MTSQGGAHRLTIGRPPSFIDDLGVLVPPSPVLTPSIMTRSCTSEEVPLLLFSSESNDEIVSPRRVSILDGSSITISDSTDTMATARTCATFGTFGQVRGPHRKASPTQSTRKPNKYQGSLTDAIPAESQCSCSLRDMSENVIPDISTLTNGAYEVPVPLFPAVVSSSSLSAHSTASCHSLAARFREADITSPPRYSADQSMCYSMSHYDSATSLPGLIVSHFRHDRKASSASDSSALPQATLPPTSLPPSLRPMLSHAELPQNLAWLKDTVVEMLIDQEGFRSITPSFRFAGFSTNTRSLDPNETVLDGGAVQFIPTSRQTFNFHYAPFDGQPVLRRISVNGTSRDHVSRQATMCLKANGVYTVRGAETSIIRSSDLGSDSSADALKLRWKLDYYVDDRKGSGRLEGEKTFTPLTFSCSPMLLHPLQGKKVRLMHVMKKSVAAKIMAERMEPPKAIPTRSPSPSIPCDSTTTSPASPPPARADAKAHIWNLHRRFQSYGHSNVHNRSERPTRNPSPLGSYWVNETQSRGLQQLSGFRRHRRASSAGDLNLLYRGVGQDGDGKGDAPLAVLTSNKCSPMAYEKHILPPSKLSELLDNIENVEPALHQIECKATTGLTPAPRHRVK